jgi:hypothetical protein
LFLNLFISDIFPDVPAPIFQEPESAQQEAEPTVQEPEAIILEPEATVPEAGQEELEAGNSYNSLVTSKDTSVFFGCFIS